METANELNVHHAVLEYLDSSQTPVAIHTGHFMLVPRGDSCMPTVVMHSLNHEPETLEANMLGAALSRFSLETWRMGARLSAHLQTLNRRGDLLTLVNDWQYMRNGSVPNANALRLRFYRDHPNLFPSFAGILKDFELGEEVVLALGPWKPFVSESWLRRRIERRLKRMIKAEGPSVPRLTIRRRFDGAQQLVFDDFGHACSLLVCGQADCAGEVMELIYMLYEMGYRRLVNFIPKECEIPVNEGTRRAIAVFRFDDFAALNIAVPCLAAACSPNGASRTPSISRVFAERDAGNELEAFVESVSGNFS